MARCSLILSNMEKSLGSHECGPKGLSDFWCLLWKFFPLNYYNVCNYRTFLDFDRYSNSGENVSKGGTQNKIVL